MAVNRIDLEVYDDPSMESQYQIGNTITTDGSNLNIEINDTTLGGEELINPGYKYWIRTKAYNTEGFESEWANGEFVTMPYPDCQITADTVPYLQWWANFDPSVITIQSWGVSVSPNEDGSNAVNYTYNEPYTDHSAPLEVKYLFGLAEHTEYFYVPFYLDSLGRYYQTPWEECYSFTTKWFDPYVSVLQATTTTDSITLTIDRQTNDPSIGKTFFVLGGKSVEVSNGVKGVGTYTITDGDSTTHGSTISIQPNTTYTVQVQFATSDNLGTDSVQVTTQAAPSITVDLATTSVQSGRIAFQIDVEVEGGLSVGIVEVNYRTSGGTWQSLQTEPDEGIQTFQILTQPNTTYQIQTYVEDSEGEYNDAKSIVVTTPAS